MNELSVIQSVDDVSRVSKALAASGYFKDANDAAKAFVKVLAGHELKIPAFASMTGIHIIQGKPELGANILASLVKGSGKYNYRVVRLDDEACHIDFYEMWNGRMEKSGESVFTAADAKRAGTQNMAKFPRNMLFARAMSNGVKWFCPDVTSGVAVYSEGEISGVNTIDAEPVQSPHVHDEYLTVEPNSGEVVGMKEQPQQPQQHVITDGQVTSLKIKVASVASENGLDSKQTEQLQQAFKSAINDKYAENGSQFRITSTKQIPAVHYPKIMGEYFGELCEKALQMTISQ
jgi:hypothetical protein